MGNPASAFCVAGHGALNKGIGMSGNKASGGRASFSLLRRFALASAVVIALIAAGNSYLISSAITRIMLEREGQVSADFVLNVLRADRSIQFFTDSTNADKARQFADSMLHITSIEELERVNVYSASRVVLWSTDRSLIGKQFGSNPELDAALVGRLVVEGGRRASDAGGRAKPEHVGLQGAGEYFFETYIPVSSGPGAVVVGAVELYRSPLKLSEAILSSHGKIWMVAVAGALFLYFTLFGIVGAADLRIREQNEQLRKSETMSMVGEFAAAIAHNIRNPLASIRTTAELARDSIAAEAGDFERIMQSCDKIEAWVRDLVYFSHLDSSKSSSVDPLPLMENCIEDLRREFRCDTERLRFSALSDTCMVGVDPALLRQVFRVLLVNALQAVGSNGVVKGTIDTSSEKVIIRVSDNGPGIQPEVMGRLFELFFTTKSNGMGMGLALARRAVERFGGGITASSVPGAGSVFTIELPRR